MERYWAVYDFSEVNFTKNSDLTLILMYPLWIVQKSTLSRRGENPAADPCLQIKFVFLNTDHKKSPRINIIYSSRCFSFNLWMPALSRPLCLIGLYHTILQIACIANTIVQIKLNWFISALYFLIWQQPYIIQFSNYKQFNYNSNTCTYFYADTNN